MSNVTIEPARLEQKYTVANLMQLYLHDLSEHEERSLGSDGLFDLGAYFDAYWSEDHRYPFLIWVNEELAGFAFVREVGQKIFSMAEFFVSRKFRGTGIATQAATALFDRFQGEWHVAQMEENVSAQRFWRRTIREYTNDRFKEAASAAQPRGIKQVFSNGPS